MPEEKIMAAPACKIGCGQRAREGWKVLGVCHIIGRASFLATLSTPPSPPDFPFLLQGRQNELTTVSTVFDTSLII